ncbi:ectin-like [Lingula anatina]|uniref:Ectin-like n=1 Tax=Lingula anatina TaxID=7574 RepID=A0A1S3JPA1_LINAN|nr:ectin-like [Lingula anatina]|eukprot:XP_013412177.1 ectin-like [Lingula anatina]
MNDKELQAFQESCLRAHNAYRSDHGCPELTWSVDLAKQAQEWADRVAEKKYLQYSENPNVGESIFLVDSEDQLTGEAVTEHWYAEGYGYDYKNPRWRKDSKRFSQLIWRNSHEVGVGVAHIPGTGKHVVVANYKPPGNGNFPGEYRKNVPPPLHAKDIPIED